MEILPKLVKDLLNQNPEQVRDALRRFREEPELQAVTFIDHQGKAQTLRRVHPN